MSEYITRFNHFTFSQNGDSLVVTSERDEDFEATFNLPDDFPVDDGEALFNEYYTKAYSAYQEYKS